MTVIDLTDSYITHVIGSDNWSAYTEQLPELFSHYNRFWASPEYGGSHVEASLLLRNRTHIYQCLPYVTEHFEAAGFDTSDIRVILFVGYGKSNGHAFEDNDSFVVWLPIECYPTRTQADVFVTHEIAHCLHYTATPHFYFRTEHERYSIARLLITEGIATELTTEILGINALTALWADYLSEEKARAWLTACAARKSEIAAAVHKSFRSSVKNAGLFCALDPDDVLEYRAGYYIGTLVTKAICERHSCPTSHLIHYSREQLEREYLQIIEDWSFHETRSGHQ